MSNFEFVVERVCGLGVNHRLRLALSTKTGAIATDKSQTAYRGQKHFQHLFQDARDGDNQYQNLIARKKSTSTGTPQN